MEIGRRWGRRLAIPALTLALLAGCGSGHAHSGLPAAPDRLYRYDRSSPLRLRDRAVINPSYPIKVHDVDFESPRGGRVPAFLVVPPSPGPHPAVIFMHGSGGTRWEFLLAAVALARRGVVAITITSPFERSPQRILPQPRELKHDRDRFVQEVVDLRRAVDVLVARNDVDAQRLGFVGFSRGAETGAVLAGVEPRIRAFDLISGGGSMNFVPPLSPTLRRRAEPLLASFRPSRFIGYAHAPLLLQMGRHDEEIARPRQLELIRAAPEPKTVLWYDAGHSLGPQAVRDSAEWLARELRPTSSK
jgi:dienelactone hydrolase